MPTKTIMIYGPSGTGKTTQIGNLAKYIWKKHKKVTRLISAMESWEPIEDEGLVQAGLVSPFSVTTRKNILGDMRKLSRGYWPKIIEEDQVQKDSEGNELFDENKGIPLVKRVKVRRLVEDKDALAKVGMYVVEKASSVSDAFLNHLVKINDTDEKGKPLKIGSEGVTGRYEEDGEIFGGNATGHFNVVQTEMHGLFRSFGALPIELMVWSSSVGKGLNKRTKGGKDIATGRHTYSGESCYAPLLAGEAKNALIPEWVSECFHFEDQPEIVDAETGNTLQEKRVRAYFVNHPDKDTDLNYLCKSRVGLTNLPLLRERFPHGFVELGTGEGEGIEQYFEFLDSLRGSNIERAKEWMKTNG